VLRITKPKAECTKLKAFDFQPDQVNGLAIKQQAFK
jgi:hypothetical protein